MTDAVDRTANDNTAPALSAAKHNYKLLRAAHWCKCGNGSEFALANAAYYRDPASGSHGWMCGMCKGIIQLG